MVWTFDAGAGLLPAVLLLGLLAGCDQAGDPVEPAADAIDLEAKLDDLFAPPTTAEVEAVRADWAQRDVSAAEATIELAESYPLSGTPATLRIVSHRVGEVLHYGAILAPDSAAPGSLPILMYLHGGDSGVEVDDIGIVLFALGELRDNFVYVIPSFRSEPLEYEDREWVSTGPGGHWDYDVDDALALLNVCIGVDAAGEDRKPELRRRQPRSRRCPAGRDPRRAHREHRGLLRPHRLLRRLGPGDCAGKRPWALHAT